MRHFSIALILLAVSMACWADEIRLKDGVSVQGRIVEETTDDVILETAAGRRTISRMEIDTVVRDSNRVEVVLKSGATVQGELIRESTSTVVIQTAFSRVEIAKINIKTINGKSAFHKASDAIAPPPEDVHPEEVLIPAGTFWMGDSRGKDNPAHKIYLDAYWIDKYEVTNAQYRKFAEATGRKKPRYSKDSRFDGDLQPVIGVTWEDARAYCEWAGKRLPTEAEWEKAARGGESRLYPWGDTYNPNFANHKASRQGQPVAVGSYPQGASPYGVYNMAGNVWEWCADWYEKRYYDISPTKNPVGPADGRDRVIRGGGWNVEQIDMAHRRGIRPDKTYRSLGFRCVRTPSGDELNKETQINTE